MSMVFAHELSCFASDGTDDMPAWSSPRPGIQSSPTLLNTSPVRRVLTCGILEAAAAAATVNGNMVAVRLSIAPVLKHYMLTKFQQGLELSTQRCHDQALDELDNDKLHVENNLHWRKRRCSTPGAKVAVQGAVGDRALSQSQC